MRSTRYYKKSYPDYRRAQKLAGALFGGSAPLPEIKSGDELDPLVSFDEIIVFPATTDTCSVGIVCNCQYDENGIGILVSRGKVLQIGNADEAYPCRLNEGLLWQTASGAEPRTSLSASSWSVSEVWSSTRSRDQEKATPGDQERR